MARYYPLLLGRELDPSAHPLEAKKQLAFKIVQTYHSPEIARKTLEDWNSRFSEKRLADADLPKFAARADDLVGIVVAVFEDAFREKKSRAEASRLIKQGSVQLDGKKIIDPKQTVSLQSGQVLRLDKTHAVRIQ
jgi:tyrosyl-tRNA synthetase